MRWSLCFTRVLAGSARHLGLGKRPGGASLKRIAWRSSKALGPRLTSPERLGERLFKSLLLELTPKTQRSPGFNLGGGTAIDRSTPPTSRTPAREARACADRVLKGAGGAEPGEQAAVEAASAAGGHKAGLARVGADRRCGLGEEEET
ncbi:hypothetical protein B296_00043923 [Ensete ventricosum]|uniref:Uncharacterized protein n=1 Tax=Ensete ventricosum TaxID=4639 RepID=A0A426ZCU3_ENSVE|nr:hypothetical protein B296_00043923 [Ensete ventricosum]